MDSVDNKGDDEYIDTLTLNNMLDEYSKHIPLNFNNNIMNNVKITVHFVRHAESSANYAKGDLSDEIINQPILGYNKVNNSNYNKVQTIEDTYNYVKNIPLNLSSAIKSSAYYHPILTYIGMQHGILLGKNFIKHNNHDYDVVLVSPTFRAIFTALLALRGTNKTIYVVPYINEISNVAKYITGDFQNMPVPSNVLKNCVLFFKDWLEYNWFGNFDDIELMEKLIEIKEYCKDDTNIVNLIDIFLTRKLSENNFDFDKHMKLLLTLLKNSNIDTTLLKNTLSVKFKRGPIVNFNIYEHFEKIDKKNIGCPSFDKFYNIIIPKAISDNIIPKKNNIKILCISHGTFIKGEIKRLYNINIGHPMNTEVIEEIRDTHNRPGLINLNVYKPIKIRSNYENFETLNGNICRTEGLKGILNLAIWKNNDRGIIPNHAMVSGSILHEPEYYADDDVKFYFEDRNKYQLNRSNQSVSGGGNKHYNNYLKYKAKYLHLKTISE